MTTVAIILAAGRGKRMSSSIPKPYLPLGDVPLLRYSLKAFTSHSAIDHVLTVIHPSDRTLYNQAAQGLNLLDPVSGGASRQESVHCALKSLKHYDPHYVLIHDGVRPFPDPSLIERIVLALDTTSAAIVGVPITDSVKKIEGRKIIGELDRTGLWRAQTPQGFHFKTISNSYYQAEDLVLFHDDAAIVHSLGEQVAVLQGSEDNLKITTDDDLARAEKLLFDRLSDVRCASGFDTHRFKSNLKPDLSIRLCGIKIPYTKELAGHSDSDVALHALTDALLGTVCAGDIGEHFPSHDPQWKNIDSKFFLEHASRLISQRQGLITHADITIICETPKIAPFRKAMEENVASLLDIDGDRVSVKASTTEKLGFTGRGEGITAHALATVRLPWSYK